MHLYERLFPRCPKRELRPQGSGRPSPPSFLSALAPKLVVPTDHDAFFAPLERGLHLLPGIDLEGFVSEVFTLAHHASVVTPDYEEPICVPPEDARGSVLAAS